MYLKQKGIFFESDKQIKLKNGGESSCYFDIRRVVNYPHLSNILVRHICTKIREIIGTESNYFIVGVPSGAVPIAAMIARDLKLPYAIYRDKIKDYGKHKILEVDESFRNKKIILIEDVVTTGKSVLNVYNKLRKLDYTFAFVLSVVNRNPVMPKFPFTYYSVFGIEDFQPLKKLKTKVKFPKIIFSCDTDDLKTITAILPHVAGVKIHPDCIEKKTINMIQSYCLKNKMLLINDAKLADIPHINTKKLQNPEHICDAVTAVATSVESINAIGNHVLLLYSCSHYATSKEYRNRCLEIAAKSPYVIGLISQEKIPNFVCFTPGVTFGPTTSTHKNIKEIDSDYYIMGRSIYLN